MTTILKSWTLLECMYNVIYDILSEIRITNDINFVKANDNVLFPGGCKFTHSCEKVMKPTKLSERKGGSF